MHTIRTPNIRFNRHIEINGIERRPDKWESLGRKGMGPFKKNFDIPNELVNKLKRNVPTGRASFMLSYEVFVKPAESLG